MGPVWALLLLLLPIAQGADLTCDARQNNAQCYGALGGTLQIQLMDKGSTTDRCEWFKKSDKIFTWKNTTSNILNDSLKNRSEFNASTGIFHLHNLSKDDTDSYTLGFLDKNGRSEKILTHKLIIEAPVSSVLLDPKCLSKGERLVTCTAEGGGSPEFSWTLDGQNLTDSQLLSKNDANNIITLTQNTKGLLRCSVRNNVSQVYEERNISTCVKGYWTIIVGVLAAVLIAAMVATALLCVLKKRSKNNGDEEHELTYADVRILRQPGRRAQPQPSEIEVEYGQVNFSNQSRPVPEAADNSCIYAKVRR